LELENYSRYFSIILEKIQNKLSQILGIQIRNGNQL